MAVVPAGTIEDHHGMGIRGDLAADLAEVMVQRDGMADRHDQRRRLALRRADRTKQIGRGEAEIFWRHRPAAGLPPYPGPAVLLANESLVLKPYLDSRTGRLHRPGLALIAIQELRKLCLRRRIGPRVARARRQPAQLYPMQQPVGARQAAINLKLLLQYALRIDRAKRHYPIPLQLGVGDNPFLEPRACHGVHPWLSTRARPVTQSLNAFLFVAVMPFVSR